MACCNFTQGVHTGRARFCKAERRLKKRDGLRTLLRNSRSFPPQATHEHSKAPLRHLRRKKPRFLNSKRAARVEACRVVPARVVDYVAERALRRATKWL